MMDLGDLLAIDPSIVSPGVSIFRNGQLVASTFIKVAKPTNHVNEAIRCMAAADAVAQWVRKIGASPIAIAYEWPQIYDRDTPATANAVISMAGVDLALTCGFAVSAAMRGVNLQILSYKPAEVWGQLSKSKTGSYWECARGKRVWSRLGELERAVTVDQHDAGDSVGIGLHALNRLGLRRALASSL